MAIKPSSFYQLASTAAEISDGGGDVAFKAADVSKEEDCRRIVDAAREKFGPATILVNNAGHYGPVVPVEEYPLADFDQVIAVHLRAAFLLTQLVLPEMYEHEHGLFSTFPVCRPRLLFRGVLPTLPPKPACWA